MHAASKIRGLTAPIEETVICRTKIRKWAAENAYTLLFLSALFVVTWVIMIIIAITGEGR